jgi:hypothetical protein
LNRINKNKKSGSELAISGIIISSIMILISIIIIGLFIALFTFMLNYLEYTGNTTVQLNATEGNFKINLANPAVEYCVKNENKIETREDSKGEEYEVCVSPNGKECDKWEYFRGECQL